jgi:hypothetical protein
MVAGAGVYIDDGGMVSCAMDGGESCRRALADEDAFMERVFLLLLLLRLQVLSSFHASDFILLFCFLLFLVAFFRAG